MNVIVDNAVNELVAFAQGAGQPAWPAPAYDPAGNMTSGPKGTHPNGRSPLRLGGWAAWFGLRRPRRNHALPPPRRPTEEDGEQSRKTG